MDYVRGLAMIGVIYAHAMHMFADRPDGFYVHAAFVQGQAVASFVMPLFFAASGAASAQIAGASLRKVMRGSLQLLVLALLVHPVGVLLSFGVLHLEPNPWDRQFLIDTARHTLLGLLSVPVLWFLVTLAIIRLPFYWLVAKAPRWAFWPALAGVAFFSLVSSKLPEALSMTSWPGALAFMLLGHRFAKAAVSVPAWLIVPAGLGVVLLAPLNGGCPTSFTGSCPNTGDGGFYVNLLDGYLGFGPLFFLTAILGCIAALGLARLMARHDAPVVGLIGRNSLTILIAHGLIMTATFSPLREAALPRLHGADFLLLLAGLIAVNLLAMRAVETPLRWVQRIAAAVVDRLLAALWPKAPAGGGRSAVRPAAYPASFSSSSSEMS